MNCCCDGCENVVENFGRWGKRFCSRKCQRKQSQKNRRNKMKRKAVEYKGGVCGGCGYNNSHWALQFHHLDPTKKDFQLSSGKMKEWETTKKELDKCALVCANCHAEVHHGVRELDIST